MTGLVTFGDLVVAVLLGLLLAGQVGAPSYPERGAPAPLVCEVSR